jgi:hypothetical protein
VPLPPINQNTKFSSILHCGVIGSNPSFYEVQLVL